MGCIQSKKDLNDLNPNVYSVVNLDDNREPLWNGHLELSRIELTLHRKGKEPTTWPLQCLRRYGFEGEIFTFEAGRRCLTGEGIYAFRCERADSLFQQLQSYLHNEEGATNSGDIFPLPTNGQMVISRSHGLQTSTVPRPTSQTAIASTNGGNSSYILNNNIGPSNARLTNTNLSPSGTIQSNPSHSTDTLSVDANYLEPIPLLAGTVRPRLGATMRYASVGSGPISPEPHSPGSPNSISNILEVTTLNPLPSSHHGVSNLYQEFPLRDHSSQWTNQCTTVLQDTESMHNKKLELDIPPQEQAPGVGAPHADVANLMFNVSPTNAIDAAGNSCSHSGSPTCMTTSESFDNSHMYMNVTPGEIQFTNASNNNSAKASADQTSSTTPNANSIPAITTTSSGLPFGFPRQNSTYSMDPNRFYENLEPGEIRPLLLRNRYSKPDIFAKVELPLDKSEPCTPTTANRRVNYIVLDLDQVPAININATPTNPSALTPGQTSVSPPCVNSGVTPHTSGGLPSSTVTSPNTLLPPESPKKAALGYATIDFNKTVALSNSTTPSSDLDSEGSRKTRHSSTAASATGPPTRHSNSISD